MRHRLSFLDPYAIGGCGNPSGATAMPAAPASFPAAPLTTIDGRPADLASVIQGRPAIVSLWGTWCDSCLTEIDALKRLDAEIAAARRRHGQGVGRRERRETVAAFAHSRGPEIRALGGHRLPARRALGERRDPGDAVVDREGRIVYRGRALDEPALTAFRRALAAAPAPDSICAAVRRAA